MKSKFRGPSIDATSAHVVLSLVRTFTVTIVAIRTEDTKGRSSVVRIARLMKCLFVLSANRAYEKLIIDSEQRKKRQSFQ